MEQPQIGIHNGFNAIPIAGYFWRSCRHSDLQRQSATAGILVR